MARTDLQKEFSNGLLKSILDYFGVKDKGLTDFLKTLLDEPEPAPGSRANNDDADEDDSDPDNPDDPDEEAPQPPPSRPSPSSSAPAFTGSARPGGPLPPPPAPPPPATPRTTTAKYTAIGNSLAQGAYLGLSAERTPVDNMGVPSAGFYGNVPFQDPSRIARGTQPLVFIGDNDIDWVARHKKENGKEDGLADYKAKFEKFVTDAQTASGHAPLIFLMHIPDGNPTVAGRVLQGDEAKAWKNTMRAMNEAMQDVAERNHFKFTTPRGGDYKDDNVHQKTAAGYQAIARNGLTDSGLG